jgi:hypothetical protein|nr:MAG TPA: hypothetical protein [Caudoviricetes sp.]
MDRKAELLETIDHNKALIPLVNEVVFLEGRLEELKKLPFLKIHPKQPDLQRATPAAKQYKELLQQYTNAVKILMRASGIDEDDEDSPLRKWVKEHINGGGEE